MTVSNSDLLILQIINDKKTTCGYEINKVIAEKGYRYVPKRYLICVKTVSDMYNWTADQILKNPFIIYRAKVKPLIINILTTVLENIIDPTTKKTTLFPCFEQSQPRFQSLKI